MNITTVKQNKLEERFKKQLSSVVSSAEQDPFLMNDSKDIEKSNNKEIIIWENKEVIGFFTPTKTNYKGVSHWRAGALYLITAQRGKGIMEYVLTEFYKKHQMGIVWINDENLRSINLFKKLGFEKDKARDHEGKPGHWYRLSNFRVGNENYSW